VTLTTDEQVDEAETMTAPSTLAGIIGLGTGLMPARTQTANVTVN